tara:strand:+ start:1024 stop:1473 length:450 start_codon:yes stop_codon:yes gene_type:complete
LKAIIRLGRENDMPALLALIKELAEYERAAEQVENTEAQLLADWQAGWFEFLVAELQGEVVGISLYYKRYSTWKGTCFYLEDLYVKPELRGQGIGLDLLKETAKTAKKAGANRLDWQVIDWNTPAVDFYKKLGADIETEWWNCKLDLRN